MSVIKSFGWKRWLVVAGAIALVYLVFIGWFFVAKIRQELSSYLWISNLQAAGRLVFVHGDGSIYVQTDDGVECFDPQGKLLFAHERQPDVQGWLYDQSPPTDALGRIYLMEVDYRTAPTEASLYVVAPEQVYDHESSIVMPQGNSWWLCLGAELIFAVGDGGEVVALDYEGVEKWRYVYQSGLPNLSSGSTMHQLFDTCGDLLCLIDGNNRLVVLDASGEVSWEQKLLAAGTNIAVRCTPAGEILIVADNSLIAYDQQGNELWRFDPGTQAGASQLPPVSGIQVEVDMPVIAPDGSIAYLDGHLNLYKLSSDGQLLWSATQNYGYGPLTIIHGADSSLYSLVSYGQVTKYDAQGQQVYIKQLDSYMQAPAMSPEGIIYELRGGSLCALDIDKD